MGSNKRALVQATVYARLLDPLVALKQEEEDVWSELEKDLRKFFLSFLILEHENKN